MLIPKGICVDLETTIAGKCDHRINGEKRYVTRILEIGAVNWCNPSETFGCLVNPIPEEVSLNSAKDLIDWLQTNYQKPTPTIQFWSKVLVNGNSLTANMFLHPEDPQIWLRQSAANKAKDFIRWRNNPTLGPTFVSEKQGLQQLIAFTKNRDWLAHNGNSFDYKVLQGCSNRTDVIIPDSIRKFDSLKIFRTTIPGYKSYSQPKLYSAIFKKDYNAHIAIDDAKALAELCQYVTEQTGQTEQKTEETGQRCATTEETGQRETKTEFPKMNLKFGSPMNLKFGETKTEFPKMNLQFGSPMNLKFGSIVKNKQVGFKKTKLSQIRGIGPKTIAALAILNVLTISQLKAKIKINGTEWLKNNIPFGANHKQIYKNIQVL